MFELSVNLYLRYTYHNRTFFVFFAFMNCLFKIFFHIHSF